MSDPKPPEETEELPEDEGSRIAELEKRLAQLQIDKEELEAKLNTEMTKLSLLDRVVGGLSRFVMRLVFGRALTESFRSFFKKLYGKKDSKEVEAAQGRLSKKVEVVEKQTQRIQAAALRLQRDAPEVAQGTVGELLETVQDAAVVISAKIRNYAEQEGERVIVQGVEIAQADCTTGVA